MDSKLFSGTFIAMEDNFELPEKLKNFLSIDDQGIEGLEFMLKDPKLSKRIPEDVRLEYEIVYAKLSTSIDDNIAKLRAELDKLEKNPQSIIHNAISYAYSKNK